MDFNSNCHQWKASEYYLHSSAQKIAALQLLDEIKFSGSENILDVGCGDGKITALISKKLPTGSIIGIDLSKAMIDFALMSYPRELYPNLSFLVQNAQSFNFNHELDVIFSSFALQWLPNPELFFNSAQISLKSTGYLAATIPLGISNELEKAIHFITHSKEWSPYFKEFSSGWHFKNSDQYNALLIQHSFQPIIYNVINQSFAFPSREHFEKYVIQWLTHLNAIPLNLKQMFFSQLMDKYIELIPPSKEGIVIFNFPRLDFLAQPIL